MALRFYRYLPRMSIHSGIMREAQKVGFVSAQIDMGANFPKAKPPLFPAAV